MRRGQTIVTFATDKNVVTVTTKQGGRYEDV